MIYNKLYNWQKSLVDQYYDRESFGLFLDMGLGKTPISLAFAEKNNCTKILIITINSKVLEISTLEGSWLNWCNNFDIHFNYSIKNSTNFSNETNDIYIVNYESLYSRSKNKKSKVELKQTVIDFINSCKDHNVAIIIDESHKMKDLQSLQSCAIYKIQRFLKLKAKKVYSYLLTGTPFTTGYIDLYTQLKFLGWEETKTSFIENFCIRGNIYGLLGWQQPIVGYKNIEKLFEIVHQYAITINSDSVINLPDQIFINHKQNKSKEFDLFTNEKYNGKEIYNYAKSRFKIDREVSECVSDELLKERYINICQDKKINNPYYRDIAYDFKKLYPSSEWLAETIGQFWLRSRQLSIGFIGNEEKSEWYNYDRLNNLKEFLRNNEDNYVLFYNYTPELLKLYDLCSELDYKIDVYCGSIKSLNFYEKYQNQNKEERLSNTKNIILANFASGSTGLNWQLYNKCIIFSLPLYKDWAQGLKRIHRTGQTKTVIYHVFWQNNWLDENMYAALREGKDYNDKMFESDLNRVKEIL